MLIQKIFHVHENVTDAKNRLRNFHHYRRVFEGVIPLASGRDGAAGFEFVTGNGFRAQVEVAELPTDDPNQSLFRSVDGNMEVAVLVEYFPIHDELTEVQLTVDYTIGSHMYSVLDAVTSSIDRFLNRHLRRLETYLSGEQSVVTPEHRFRPVRRFAHEPQLAH